MSNRSQSVEFVPRRDHSSTFLKNYSFWLYVAHPTTVILLDILAQLELPQLLMAFHI